MHTTTTLSDLVDRLRVVRTTGRPLKMGFMHDNIDDRDFVAFARGMSADPESRRVLEANPAREYIYYRFVESLKEQEQEQSSHT
jgi:hypothetical protein